MTSELVKAQQSDFSAGMFRIRYRDRIPANGAWNLENSILDDRIGAPQRSGSTYLSPASFGTGLTFLWDGIVGGRHKTLVANDSDFGVLAADDQTFTNLGGDGLRMPVKPAVFADKLYLPGGVTFDGNALGVATMKAAVYLAAGGRLIACNGSRAYMSRPDGTFASDEFHELPQGAEIIAGEGTRDRAALFTTEGVWLISNVELDLTDDAGNVQQQLDVFSRDLVTWGGAGIAGWQGGLVVPAMDGVWLMNVGADPVSGPAPFTMISRPIEDLYSKYVRLGYRPGGATVFRGHYLLPILNGPSVVDLLVCRLDRVTDRQGSRGWTHFTGHGGELSALVVRQVGSQPVLLGAQRLEGKVSRLRYFEDTASHLDADGTAPLWEVVTRDVQTGDMQTKSLVKKLRVECLLTAAPPVQEDALDVMPPDGEPEEPSTPPGPPLDGITAEWSREEPVATAIELWDATTWNGSVWAASDDGFVLLDGSAPEDVTGAVPFVWRINKQAERIRVRLRCSDTLTKARFRSIELHIRPTGRF